MVIFGHSWGASEAITLANRLNAANANPDKLSVDALCADLTNHLISGVVLTPGAVGTLVELANAGFAYVR